MRELLTMNEIEGAVTGEPIKLTMGEGTWAPTSNNLPSVFCFWAKTASIKASRLRINRVKKSRGNADDLDYGPE